jgi:hypothetical protein
VLAFISNQHVGPDIEVEVFIVKATPAGTINAPPAGWGGILVFGHPITIGTPRIVARGIAFGLVIAGAAAPGGAPP